MMTYASSWAIRTIPTTNDYDAAGEGGAAGAEGSEGGGVALPPRILNITVPQVGHLPLMALRPFFIVSSTALEISFLALHLTQYPSGINILSTGLEWPGQ